MGEKGVEASPGAFAEQCLKNMKIRDIPPLYRKEDSGSKRKPNQKRILKNKESSWKRKAEIQIKIKSIKNILANQDLICQKL